MSIEKRLRESDDPVISFSHFLPRQELCPEKRFLLYPELPKAAGSDILRERVERLQPDVHVFGHTHFGWDMEIDGIRYLQCALAYPQERQVRMSSLDIAGVTNRPALIYSCETGNFIEKQRPSWSRFYEVNARDPFGNHELAPWIRERYPPANQDSVS